MTSSKKNAGTTGADQGTIVALFRNQTDAERAIQDLQAAGVDQTPDRGRDSGPWPTAGIAPRSPRRTATRPGEFWAASPACWLDRVRWRFPESARSSSPACSPPALARISAAGGGLVTTLVAMGSTERDAKYFEKGLREGSVLVTATAGSLGSEVGEIVRAAGGDLGTPVSEAAGDLDLFGSTEAQEDPSDAADVAREPWRGSERRYHDDLSYAGPERRFSRS